MRVLLVSEDEALKGLLVDAIKSAGHEMAPLLDSAVGWRLTRGEADVVLLDLGDSSPGRWSRLAQWRKLTDLPLIGIGPVPRGHSRVTAAHALRKGCDDFVFRPVSLAELLARMEALHRRASLPVWMPASTPLPDEEAALDWRSHRVWIRGRRIDLTPLEFRVLACLLQNDGHPVSRKDLIERVWGKEQSDSSVNLYVWHLRQKIEDDPAHPKLLITLRGKGYAFLGKPGVEEDAGEV